MSRTERLRMAHAQTVRAASAYRIAFATYFLLFGFPRSAWIADFPDLFFAPPALSVAALFRGFPPRVVLEALDVVIGGLFIVLAFGFRTRAVSVLLAALLVVGNSFRYSFGKIDHLILVELTIALMAFSRWGEAYSIDALRARSGPRATSDRLDQSGAHAVLAICIAFGFLTAGVPKLVGWIDFDVSTQGVRGWLLGNYRPGVPGPLFAEAFFRLHEPLVWEALDVAAVAFELSFVVAVLDRRAFQLALCEAAFFHLFNYLVLGIAFATNLIAYAAFLEWDRLVGVAARAPWRVPVRSRPVVATMTVCLAAYFLASSWNDRPPVPLLALLGADRAIDLTLVQVTLGAAVAAVAIWTRLGKGVTTDG